jgi:hypothetical protein
MLNPMVRWIKVLSGRGAPRHQEFIPAASAVVVNQKNRRATSARVRRHCFFRLPKGIVANRQLKSLRRTRKTDTAIVLVRW